MFLFCTTGLTKGMTSIHGNAFRITLCAGNAPVTGETHWNQFVMRDFIVSLWLAWISV